MPPKGKHVDQTQMLNNVAREHNQTGKNTLTRFSGKSPSVGKLGMKGHA
jgi:hypothetical protein